MLDSLKSKLIILLSCMLLSGIAGFMLAKKDQKPQPTSQVSTTEVVKDKTVESDKKVDQAVKITRTQKKPDGTVTTEVIESQTKSQESTKEVAHETIKEKVVIKYKRTEYSLGLGIGSGISNLKELKPTYYVSGGKRIVGDSWLDLQLGARQDFSNKQVILGVRFEF